MHTDPVVSLKAPAPQRLPTERDGGDGDFARILDRATEKNARHSRDDNSDDRSVSHNEAEASGQKATNSIDDDSNPRPPEHQPKAEQKFREDIDRISTSPDEKTDQAAVAETTTEASKVSESGTIIDLTNLDANPDVVADEQFNDIANPKASNGGIDLTAVKTGATPIEINAAGPNGIPLDEPLATAASAQGKPATNVNLAPITTPEQSPDAAQAKPATPDVSVTAPVQASENAKLATTSVPIALTASGPRLAGMSSGKMADPAISDMELNETKSAATGAMQNRPENTINSFLGNATASAVANTDTAPAFSPFARPEATLSSIVEATVAPPENEIKLARGENTQPLPTVTSPTNTQLTSPASFVNELRIAGDISAPMETATTRPPPTPVTHQIAIQISRSIQDGNDRFTLDLKPAELGRVSVKMEVGHDGRVIAVIQAERGETLDLLQRDSRALERALQEAGLRADSGSLSFSLQGEGAEENTAENDGASAKTSNFLVQEDLIEDIPTTVTHASILNDSGVDIHV